MQVGYEKGSDAARNERISGWFAQFVNEAPVRRIELLGTAKVYVEYADR